MVRHGSNEANENMQIVVSVWLDQKKEEVLLLVVLGDAVFFFFWWFYLSGYGW